MLSIWSAHKKEFNINYHALKVHLVSIWITSKRVTIYALGFRLSVEDKEKHRQAIDPDTFCFTPNMNIFYCNNMIFTCKLHTSTVIDSLGRGSK